MVPQVRNEGEGYAYKRAMRGIFVVRVVLSLDCDGGYLNQQGIKLHRNTHTHTHMCK